jgi:hypothetical protein
MYISPLPPPGSAWNPDTGPGGVSIAGLGVQQGGSGVGAGSSDVGVAITAMSGDVVGRGAGVESDSPPPWQLANNANASANGINHRVRKMCPPSGHFREKRVEGSDPLC